MSLGRQTQSSYYDRNNRPTASLYRARQPYLIKNTATGVGIFGMVIGIYWFTLRAVSQDEFEDVKVPEVPRAPTQAPQMLSSAGPAPGINK